ncbi:MAG: transposase [Kineosporiaceae bacterium]
MVQVATVVDVAGEAGGPRSSRATRRTFTNEYKRAIVAEYDAAEHGHKGAVLRREGLYDSHVQEWRAAIEASTLDTPPRRGRRRRDDGERRTADLQRQVARLQAELAAKDQVIAEKTQALEVLGKGVAFLEALSNKNAR